MKKRVTTEQLLDNANAAWRRVKENVANGIIDIYQISAAMSMLNGVHEKAINENKRHLLDTE